MIHFLKRTPIQLLSTIVILAVIFFGIFSIVRADVLKSSAASVQLDKGLSVFDPIYSYEVVSQSPYPILNVGEKVVVSLRVRNTGNIVWSRGGKTSVFLGASHALDRVSVFYQRGGPGWFSGNRIKMNDYAAYPGQVVSFDFEITAPRQSGS